MNFAKEAIERFAMQHDRFPVPAARNVGVESPLYGREAATVAQVADFVANGTPIPALDSNNGVLFGALPFQALGISVDNAADCWGNKFTYAVTADLIDTTKFLDQHTDGKIVVKTTPTIVFLPTAGYVLISHGADELGAVKNNYSGNSHGWCTYIAAAPLKTENCEVSNTTILAAEFNDGKNGAANYFDDIVIYRGKPWRLGSDCECKGPGPINVFTASPLENWTAYPTCQ